MPRIYLELTTAMEDKYSDIVFVKKKNMRRIGLSEYYRTTGTWLNFPDEYYNKQYPHLSGVDVVKARVMRRYEKRPKTSGFGQYKWMIENLLDHGRLQSIQEV